MACFDICQWMRDIESVTKIQLFMHEDNLAALRTAARQTGRSMADLIREAVLQVWLRPQSDGPVALWDGEPRRTSVDHDSIYGEPW